MTTLTAPAAAAHASGVDRVWRIVRLITANPWTTIVLPWLILAAIFALNWGIWLIVFGSIGDADRADAQQGIQYSGAAYYIFVYMLVVAVQAINLTFPFALGYGSTRREFSLGAMLTFVLLSAMYAIGMTIGSVLERLTGGWGLGGTFFRTIYFGGALDWYLQLWVYFCWFLFFFFTGTIFASVFVRWRATGLSIAFVILGLLVVGAIALLTFTDSWGSLWSTIGELGVVGSVSLLLIPAAVSGVLGYLLLRRATPRS